MKIIVVDKVIHNNENRISMRFTYDEELIAITKNIHGARWSWAMGCWHIKDDPTAIDILLKAFKGKAFIDYSAMKTIMSEKISKKAVDQFKNQSPLKELSQLSTKAKADIANYKKWLESNRYPESTIKTYIGMLTIFLRFVSPKEASECTSNDIVRLIDEYILPLELSPSYQNQMISALKKFYDKMYKYVIDLGDISRPRPQHHLPNVLSKEDVRKILNSQINEKHRTMLSLIYACGLRRSELLELIPSDVERDRKLLRIRQSKGFKDRVVPLSDKVIEMLDAYSNHYKPVHYLFEGQYPGKQYSVSSLDKFFKYTCRKAGIKKAITLHGLRHSYATHLLEAGTDLRYIQELLGHKHSKTTEIYTHVTTQSIQKIRTPFDDL